jgi:hypothetical protein
LARTEKQEARLKQLIEGSSNSIDLRKKEDLSEIERIAETLFQRLATGDLDLTEKYYSSNSSVPIAF